MEQERAPLRALESQKKTLETQSTAFGTFLTKLGAVETAVKDLAQTDSLARLTATSSDDGVGVTTTSGTIEGTYEVIVNAIGAGPGDRVGQHVRVGGHRSSAPRARCRCSWRTSRRSTSC